ncbi:MAG TPA: response regulator [Kofleriaceae bacterium]|nr:response regulator [Kofleriaceae bacterium]
MSQDPYKYFRVEARELVAELGKEVLALEKDTSPGRVAHMLRLAHTLKGAARVVKQAEIADHAHALEDALTPHRETGGPVPRSGVDRVLVLIDEIGGRVQALDAPPAAAGEPAQPRAPVEEPLRTLRTEVAEIEELLDGMAEARVSLGQMSRGLDELQRVRRLAEAIAAQVEGSSNGAAATGERRGQRTGGMAEELLGACAALDRALSGAVEQMDRQLREVRQGAERMRLVPASAMFTTLERASRDVAAAQGKQVAFEATGGELRLDAHVLGVMQAALLHIVRNAVAHGIESEAERRAAGKPAAGLVRLEVTRRGRRVAFVCRDDGRGVDFDAVRRIAAAKGLLPDGGATGPEALLDRLLAGGISTSRTVSEMAGRGIGLDVVREAVERLAGQIAVRTEPGTGTAIDIEVPISLASLEALQVEVGGVCMAIPLDAVRSTVHVAAHDVASSAGGDTIVHRGQVVPFLALSRALGGGAAPARRARWPSVLVEGARGSVVLGVDRLLGTGSVVVRPLPDLCPASAAVAGASLDEDGNPRLVLDADGLVAAAVGSRPEAPAAQAAHRPILVIDDSLTTRMLEQSILESAGYQVEVATSAEDALDRVRRERFALFLVDVEMPGMDGFSFVERTQADPNLRDIPAILVTSRCAPEDLRRGQEVGARGYMVKSEFNQVELLDRIRSLVE